MKRIAIMMMLSVIATVAGAQTIGEWSRWFDGRVLYTAHILDSGEIFFDAPENTEGTFCFSLRKEGHAPGEYTLVPHNYTDDAPLRAQYGWRVQYIRKEGMYFLAVRDGFDEVVWTLTLTPDNLQNCLGQEAFAEEQPLEEMIDGYLMNTAFLSRIPKEKIREMVSLLESRPARSIIEQTNLSLMRSELKVTEAERSGEL
jgi:hypothetical protein